MNLPGGGISGTVVRRFKDRVTVELDSGWTETVPVDIVRPMPTRGAP